MASSKLIPCNRKSMAFGMIVFNFTCHHFNTFLCVIKVKKPKLAALAPQNALPTAYELASLAVKLCPDTPEGQNDFPKQLNSAVQKAETLWLLSRGKVSQMRFADEALEQISKREKRLLENARRPKKFPTSMESIIRCLIPRRSVEDRKTICKKFIDLVTKDDFKTAFALELKADITELEWQKFVVLFQTWYPAYQKDLASNKASRAAKIGHLKKSKRVA